MKVVTEKDAAKEPELLYLVTLYMEYGLSQQVPNMPASSVKKLQTQFGSAGMFKYQTNDGAFIMIPLSKIQMIYAHKQPEPIAVPPQPEPAPEAQPVSEPPSETV